MKTVKDDKKKYQNDFRPSLESSPAKSAVISACPAVKASLNSFAISELPKRIAKVYKMKKKKELDEL